MAIFLPYPAIMALGRGIGRMIHRFAQRRRHIACVNIRLCFPELDQPQQERLVKSHFESLGMGLMEVGMGYWMPVSRLEKLIEFHGLEHIGPAYQRGKGVIFLTAHFTSLELSGLYLSWHADYRPMYRPHENPVVQYFLETYRTKRAAAPITKDDVRSMIKTLRQNRGVWFAPDQNFSQKGGVFSNFFNQPAASNPATSRFAALTGAAVVPYVLLRKSDGTGYEMTVEPMLEDFPSDDSVADTQRITDHIERWARTAPEQYNWVHRRFKTRPEGMSPLYARNKPR
jgi:KDO2-lipid IV(A) lauroyltransferase